MAVMYEHGQNGWKYLEMAVNGRNGVNGQKCWKMLKMARKKQHKMTGQNIQN